MSNILFLIKHTKYFSCIYIYQTIFFSKNILNFLLRIYISINNSNYFFYITVMIILFTLIRNFPSNSLFNFSTLHLYFILVLLEFLVCDFNRKDPLLYLKYLKLIALLLEYLILLLIYMSFLILSIWQHIKLISFMYLVGFIFIIIVFLLIVLLLMKLLASFSIII